MTNPTPVSASASRGPPAMIRPIIIDGISYRGVAGNAEADGQAGGFLGAFATDGRLLWTVKIYDNRRIAGVEGDAQDVYFEAMTLSADGTILIVNEDGKRFRFDPRTRSVTALPSPVPPEAENFISPD